MNFSKRVFAVVLSVIMLLSTVPMAAADDDYPELIGHRYEEELIEALTKGYISGYEDGSVRPDNAITKGEAVMLLVKNLVSDPAALSKGSWTKNVMETAYNWELINSTNNLSVSLNRMEAYVMLAKAAQIYDEEEDTSVIDGLSDGEYIAGENRYYIAGLINRGVLEAQGSGLGVYKRMTRGEFISLFVKMAREGIWEDAKKELNDRSIKNVTLSFDHPERLGEGETLSVTVNIDGGKRGTKCTAVWYRGGAEVGREDIVLNGRKDKFTFEIEYSISRYTPDEEIIGFELYHAENGKTEKKGGHYTQYINHDYEKIVKKISNKYEGDYTLQYAEEHDYTDAEKTVFVNYNGYSSTTQYLIWVNRAYQRTNVFEGSKGHWKLIKTFIVGTGRPGSVTPVGVYKVTGKQEGWYKSKYDVKPIVRFYERGYAFHSRLLYHGTDEVKDPSIGFPVSLGCMRMYNEDIQWMYDEIPIGTTVVVW